MQNVGTIDRLLRLIVGLALLAVAFVPSVDAALKLPALGAGQWVIAAVGVVMLLTAIVRVCPLYTVLGIRTCAVKQ
jgi:Protein of unknown function (DUF2892)